MGGPPDKRSFVYQYHPTRSRQVATNFFDDFKGYLHADCYQAYVNLGKKEAVIHVACLAHARRYFVDVTRLSKKKKGLAHQVVEQFAELYKIEKELKEQKASVAKIYMTRQQKSQAILTHIKTLIENNLTKIPPQGPLAKAVNYMLGHYQSLSRYLDDGRLEIDNNRSERSIKPFVIGRKNWLFHNNVKGAKAGAVLFSLIETCKQHNVDVFAWLKFALKNIQQADTVEKLKLLLPFNVPTQSLE